MEDNASRSGVQRILHDIRADLIGSVATVFGVAFDKSCNSRQTNCNSCGNNARISSRIASAFVLMT